MWGLKCNVKLRDKENNISIQASIDDVTDALEKTFVEMSDQNTAGCFQRLFCDMAADPTGYEDHLPMMTAAQSASSMKFNNKVATDVVSRLNQAMAYGQSMTMYQGKARALLCESYYKCPFTGSQMGFAITEVEKIENAVQILPCHNLALATTNDESHEHFQYKSNAI